MATEVTYVPIPADVVKKLSEYWAEIKPETLTGPVIEIDTILRRYRREIDTDIKRCPFCGGEAKVVVHGIPDSPASYVFCAKCGVGTISFNSTNTHKAKEVWNRRVE